jgi:hypothetical protein
MHSHSPVPRPVPLLRAHQHARIVLSATGLIGMVTPRARFISLLGLLKLVRAGGGGAQGARGGAAGGARWRRTVCAAPLTPRTPRLRTTRARTGPYVPH